MASNPKARRTRSLPALSHPAICSGAHPSASRSRTKVLSVGSFSSMAFTPPAQLIGSGGVKRRITPAGQGVAAQFPRYGGFRALKRPVDGADRAAGRPHDGDLVSFLVQQMLHLASELKICSGIFL